VAKGGQLLISYGADLTNDELLLNYGFASLNNGNERLTVGWGMADVPQEGCTAKALAARLVRDDSAEGLDRREQLACSLEAGGRLELELSHATCVPAGLLEIACAVSADDATSSADPDPDRPEAWRYIESFLSGKLTKLLKHLMGVMAVPKGHGSVESQDISHVGVWDSFVESSSVAEITIGENSYTTCPRKCAVVYFDAKLAVLQHALAEAKERAEMRIEPDARQELLVV
jgi:hypothetical protein